MELVTLVHGFCQLFPKHELYALTNQIWRAAVSIPSNIAEGAARGTQKEFLQFVIIARGSLSELETQLEIAVNVGYLSEADAVFEKMAQVSRLMSGLVKYLQTKK